MKLLKRRVEKDYGCYTELVQKRAEVIYLYSDIESRLIPHLFTSGMTFLLTFVFLTTQWTSLGKRCGRCVQKTLLKTTLEENVVTELENMGLSLLSVRTEPQFSTSHTSSPVMRSLSKSFWLSPPSYLWTVLFERIFCTCKYLLDQDTSFMNKDIYASQDS